MNFSKWSNHAKGIALSGIGVLIISPDALFVRLVDTDVWTIVFWRAFFVAIGLTLIVLATKRTLSVKAFTSMGRPGLLISVLYDCGMTAFIYAVEHTSVAHTLIILSTTPLFAALVSWFWIRQHISRRTWIAIGVVVLGIVVMSSATGEQNTSVVGDLAAILGAFSLGTTFTVAQRYPNQSMLPGFIIGALLLVLVMSWLASPLSVSVNDMIFLSIMGCILLPLGMTFMYLGPRYISSAEVGLMMLLETVLGPLWVWVVMGESPSGRTLTGGAIIISALILNLYIGIRSQSKYMR